MCTNKVIVFIATCLFLVNAESPLGYDYPKPLISLIDVRKKEQSASSFDIITTGSKSVDIPQPSVPQLFQYSTSSSEGQSFDQGYQYPRPRPAVEPIIQPVEAYTVQPRPQEYVQQMNIYPAPSQQFVRPIQQYSIQTQQVQEYRPIIQQYRPPVQQYRPVVQQYRPPVQQYRPQIEQNITPVQLFRPQIEHNITPVQQYRPPVQQYRPVVQQYRPPVQQYRPQIEQNIIPVQQLRPQIEHNITPVQQYRPQIEQNITPVQQYRPIVQQYRPQIEQNITPVQQYRPIVQQYRPQIEQNITPVQQYRPIVQQYRPQIEQNITPVQQYRPIVQQYRPQVQPQYIAQQQISQQFIQPAKVYGVPEPRPPPVQYNTIQQVKTFNRPPVQELLRPVQPVKAYTPPVQEILRPAQPFVPPVQQYVPPPAVREYVQPVPQPAAVYGLPPENVEPERPFNTQSQVQGKVEIDQQEISGPIQSFEQQQQTSYEAPIIPVQQNLDVQQIPKFDARIFTSQTQQETQQGSAEEAKVDEVSEDGNSISYNLTPASLTYDLQTSRPIQPSNEYGTPY